MHGFLNQQRAANALPQVEYSAAMTDGCVKHLRYNELNPGNAHGEDPSKPGYTPEGAGGYGSEVLAGGSWTATTNPWSNFPLHLYLLFSPASTSMGGANVGGRQCYRGSQGGRTFPSPTFFSMPSNGRTGINNTMDATGEGPYAPQELVGLPNRDTGFQSVVWLMGANNPTIVSATTESASGAIETRHVDKDTPGAQGFWRNSGVVIPVRPLDAFTTYRTTVVWQTADGQVIPASFAFETTGLENNVGISSRRLSKGRLRISIETEAEQVAASISRAGKTVPIGLKRSGSTYESTLTNLTPGSYTVCARSGGRGTQYTQASRCEAVIIKGWTSLVLSKKLGKGRKAMLAVSDSALGRRAVLRVTRYKRKCYPAYGCNYLVRNGKARKRTIKLKRIMKVPVPRAGKGGRVKVSVSLKSFKRAGQSISGSTARRTYR